MWLDSSNSVDKCLSCLGKVQSINLVSAGLHASLKSACEVVVEVSNQYWGKADEM